MTLRFLCATITFLTFSAAQAEDFRLFENGMIRGDYNYVVENLKANDRVGFSNGKWFEVQNVLGSGNVTLIIQVSDTEALRIPLKSGDFSEGNPYTQYIDFFYTGNRNLRRVGVDVVRMHGYLRGEYVVVDRLDIAYTFKDFLRGQLVILREDIPAILEKFYIWAESTAQITYIGDFSSRQFGYDRITQRWILFDHSDQLQTRPRPSRIGPNAHTYSPRTVIDGIHVPAMSTLFTKGETNDIFIEANRRITAVRTAKNACTAAFKSLRP